MGFFSNFVNSIQQKIQEKQQKRKEEQEFMRRLQLQAEVERKIAFEEEFKKNARLVAIAKAKKEAAEKSGIQKLRAMERVNRLKQGSSEPGSFFDKLSAYTQRNLAKREENLKRTAEARDVAKKMREQNLAEQQRMRQERMIRSQERPFGKTW